MNVLAVDHPAATISSGNDSPALWAADVEAARQLWAENLLVSIPASVRISFTHLAMVSLETGWNGDWKLINNWVWFFLRGAVQEIFMYSLYNTEAFVTRKGLNFKRSLMFTRFGGFRYLRYRNVESIRAKLNIPKIHSIEGLASLASKET